MSTKDVVRKGDRVTATFMAPQEGESASWTGEVIDVSDVALKLNCDGEVVILIWRNLTWISID
jgi:hypothetical protein